MDHHCGSPLLVWRRIGFLECFVACRDAASDSGCTHHLSSTLLAQRGRVLQSETRYADVLVVERLDQQSLQPAASEACLRSVDFQNPHMAACGSIDWSL